MFSDDIDIPNVKQDFLLDTLRGVVDRLPDEHPSKTVALDRLGGALLAEFEKTGSPQDLEDSVVALRRSVEFIPDCPSDDGRPARLSALSAALYLRFLRLSNPKDLHESTVYLRTAISLTHSDTSKSSCLTILGDLLATPIRFQNLGHLEDWEGSIEAFQTAVDLTLQSSPDMPSRLNNLGCVLAVPSGRASEFEDVSRAIETLGRAVNLTPSGDTSLPMRLNNLGGALHRLFLLSGDDCDLQHCVSTIRRAAGLASDAHFDKPLILHNLGSALQLRCAHKKSHADFRDAFESFSLSCVLSSKALRSPYYRLLTAKSCVQLCTDHPELSTPELLLKAYAHVVDVIPHAVWLGCDSRRRFQHIALVGRLVNAAVSTAIAVGKYALALEWLEAGLQEGQGVIWGQVHRLRTSFDDLHEGHPALAMQLQHALFMLEYLDYEYFCDYASNSNLIFKLESSGRRDGPFHSKLFREGMVGKEPLLSATDILHRVRQLPGFEDVMALREAPQLIRAAQHGPVVLVNMDFSRCDALSILPSGAVVHASLPELTMQRVDNLCELTMLQLRLSGVRGTRATMAFVLKRLWEWIVHPILSTLDVTGPYAKASHKPHITWCLTDSLVQLPLHAAGLYNNDVASGSKLVDMAVSSYTPSLSALLRAEGRTDPAPPSLPNILVVTQPKTPGLPPLPGTVVEGQMISRHFPNPGAVMLLEHERATVDNILVAMAQHPWVHLACHGVLGDEDVTECAFVVYDGRITFSALMAKTRRMEKEDRAPALAFLSACQTAAGDELVLEEAVNLAAGMLAVGYTSVVATLWSIGDADAPIVADGFYEHMTRGMSSGTTTGTAYALDAAVAQLRGEVGERNFVRWVPFVHFGA
ncbi:CHAT domain-containing protein [Vararia minispora EC-137]|uniref:CHAT domain-containing protein n=1 Tax=Vararia minispora EC-137 TaxID=1314806 RepID=A0ACB8QLJ6_9AGAM|nr:CHAT domain-containing protein [Vararia minispora EC-137]